MSREKDTPPRAKDQASAESEEMFEHVRLTPREADELAESLVTSLEGDSPRQVAKLLLLCTALTYAPGMVERETALVAVRKHAAPALPGFGQLIEGDLREALAALRGGGGAE